MMMTDRQGRTRYWGEDGGVIPPFLLSLLLYLINVSWCAPCYIPHFSYINLLPSGSEENEVLLSGSILEGILCARHFR